MVANHWGEFRRDEFLNDSSVDRKPGLERPGIFFLEPEVVDVTFVDGLWSSLNADFGTDFDEFEETDISPVLAPAIALRIEQFARAKYGPDMPPIVERRVGSRASKPLFVRVPSTELLRRLDDLARFLRDEASIGAVVVAAL